MYNFNNQLILEYQYLRRIFLEQHVRSRSVPIACSGRFDIENTAMYNLAFEWTKHAKLKEWTYAEVKNSKVPCARVSYRTNIRLSRVFEALVPTSALGLKVDKDVCVRGQVLEETVHLGELLVVDRMTLFIRAEIDNATNSLVLRVQSDLQVPWILHLLERTILSEIEGSLREYQDLLALAVCVPTVSH